MKRKSAPAFVLFGLIAIYALSKKKNNSPSSASSGTQYANPIGPELPKAENSSVTSFISGLYTGVTNALTKLMNPSQTSFIEKMTPIAGAMYEEYGIHPLITITQAAHESGWGGSGLTKKANNLYGYTGDAALKEWLKAKALPENADMTTIRAMDLSAAPFIILQTNEYVPSGSIKYFSRPGDLVSLSGNNAVVLRPFRRYDSWRTSVEDWVNLLRKSRYATAWADALKGDMPAFAQHVFEAGYATDQNYPTKLVAVAKKIEDIGTA